MDAVTPGELVAGRLPPQRDVAPPGPYRGSREGVEALLAEQIGEPGAHGWALEGVDRAAVAELIEKVFGQRKRPADQVRHGLSRRLRFVGERVNDDQLCDALALPSGVCLIKKRLVDVALRHGFNALTQAKWQAIFALKESSVVHSERRSIASCPTSW